MKGSINNGVIYFSCQRWTATKSGNPGNPINILILGSKQTINSYFTEAGWKVPDPITEKSSIKIAVDSLKNLPYPTAPVSNLYLYGRRQDLAYVICLLNNIRFGKVREVKLAITASAAAALNEYK